MPQQETLGYVELEWTCKRCGTKNPGSQRTCSGCGGAMSDQDQFELPAQQVLITDEQALKEAELGPDVHCPFCGTRNKAGSKTCIQCGGDLVGGAARQADQVMGAFQAQPTPDVPCPYCSTLNPANALQCSKCGGSLKQLAAHTPPAQPAPTGNRLKLGLVIVGVAALALCICGIVFGVLSARTTDTVGAVQAVSWERTIQIMEQRPVTHEDWQDRIPSGAQRGTCARKVRSTQGQPAPGAEKVCGTPYTIDQGSGKGKVVQDCEYQVYDSWCKYTVNEWTEVDKAIAKGNDLTPQWPDVRLRSSGQREGNRDEKYEVTFSAGNKNPKYSPKDAAEFTKFSVGSRWTLKVNTFGTIIDVQPTK
jgi:uncharacterized Zn-finger protein